MPDLKYLYRVLYILINCFFKQIVDIFLNKVYYQESYILIIEYSIVVTIAEWLDGNFESQRDFKKPGSGSIPGSPKICISRF